MISALYRICRYKITDHGAGYKAEELPELLSTSNVAFRPVDVKFGLDGALYICDWYNPIINHGEVDFRDPRRDRTHGRIWRITRADRPTIKTPHLEKQSVDQLVAEQSSQDGFIAHFPAVPWPAKTPMTWSSRSINGLPGKVTSRG